MPPPHPISRWPRPAQAVLLLALLLLAVSAAEAQVPDPDLPEAPAQLSATATLTGTVTAQGDAPVQGATVVLHQPHRPDESTLTDDYGIYTFSYLPAGPYTLTLDLTGFRAVRHTGTLLAGETSSVAPITISMSASESVQVSASQEEIAAAEVRVEETQRLAGFLPNFYVTYDWHAAPLTWRQKYDLAWKNFYDPANFIVNAAGAAIQQADNAFPAYGQGAAGYGKRLGANVADFTAATYLGGAIIPSLLHQDPRYFYKGTGTVRRRALYAVGAAFVCRGDNGKWQPNFSSVLGDLAAGAVSNAYYPAASRNGASLTFENGGLSIVGDAVGNLLQEFFFNRITPHRPHYDQAPTTP